MYVQYIGLLVDRLCLALLTSVECQDCVRGLALFRIKDLAYYSKMPSYHLLSVIGPNTT